MARRVHDFDAASMFRRADAFMLAGTDLMTKERLLAADLASPAHVCACFALELYLKVLKSFSGPPLWGHHLHELYRDLGAVEKQRLEAAWTKNDGIQIQRMIIGTIAAGAGDPTKGFPTDMFSALERSAKAFEEFRYKEGSEVLIGSTPYLVRRLILEAQPQWAPAPNTPTAELNRRQSQLKPEND